MTTQEQTIALVKPEDSHVRMEPGKQSKRAGVGSEGRQGSEGMNEDQSSGVLPARAQEGQLAAHRNGSETGAWAKLLATSALRSPYLPTSPVLPSPRQVLLPVSTLPKYTCLLGTPVSTFDALCLETLFPALFCLLTILIL